jgi:hypothetical protein
VKNESGDFLLLVRWIQQVQELFTQFAGDPNSLPRFFPFRRFAGITQENGGAGKISQFIRRSGPIVTDRAEQFVKLEKHVCFRRDDAQMN